MAWPLLAKTLSSTFLRIHSRTFLSMVMHMALLTKPIPSRNKSTKKLFETL